jgi:TonB family protein
MVRDKSIRLFAIGAAAVALLAGSAMAGERVPRTLAEWRAEVNRQIDDRLSLPAGGLRHGDHAVATVLVSLDADGRFADASIGQSSGDAAVDDQALRTARAVHYPQLPVALRGAPRTIAMMLYFGEPGSETEAIRQVGEAVALAAAAERRSDAKATAEACATKAPTG